MNSFFDLFLLSLPVWAWVVVAWFFISLFSISSSVVSGYEDGTCDCCLLDRHIQRHWDRSGKEIRVCFDPFCQKEAKDSGFYSGLVFYLIARWRRRQYAAN